MTLPQLPLLVVLVAVACLSLAAGASAASRADKTLFDFGEGFDPSAVPAHDVELTVVEAPGGGRALRIASGHDQPWPGINLVAPARGWDLSAYQAVAIEVTNRGGGDVTVWCRVDNPGADGVHNCLSGSDAVKPGEQATLTVPLKRRPTSAVKLFGMRGYPAEYGDPEGGINTADVTQLVVFVSQPTADHVFDVARVRAVAEPAGAGKFAGAAFTLPMIDTFGQYMHRDWPGKVHSLADLDDHRWAEERDLAAHPGPTDWGKWGGWAAGPKLEATGFFRTEKRDGKWWLVDPDGHLFFSNGIDCVGMLGSTAIDDRRDWFAGFPGEEPEFRQFLTKVSYIHLGYYKGRQPEVFNFAGTNLLRKYGQDYQAIGAQLAQRRLKSWGLNTIGNWSSWAVESLRRTPYVQNVGFAGPKLEGSTGYWGKFWDVFDPAFERSVRAAMQAQVGKTAGDPWCLGYFLDNEIAWGDELSLALAALESPPDQPAKKAFIDDLKAKYDTIDRLNAAWGTHHTSWDALLAATEPPDKARAHDDLAAFYTRTAEQYFRICRDAVKAAAPHNLYLGCRFAWTNPLAAAAAAKYCDVVSFNLYQRSVADFRPPDDSDVPVIIGEFHFGALDRGMFHTGLVPVADQAARAAAYESYVTGALRNPLIVGCHWFQYQDEPTTGRCYDEENYQIGFVDVADTPYPETIAASREVGCQMYRTRARSG